jgi:hypothetical protein
MAWSSARTWVRYRGSFCAPAAGDRSSAAVSSAVASRGFIGASRLTRPPRGQPWSASRSTAHAASGSSASISAPRTATPFAPARTHARTSSAARTPPQRDHGRDARGDHERAHPFDPQGRALARHRAEGRRDDRVAERRVGRHARDVVRRAAAPQREGRERPGRERSLGQVHPVGPAGEGDVRSIAHEERRAAREGERPQRVGRAHHRPRRRARGAAQPDRRRPRAQGGLEPRGELGRARVGEVGAEPEAAHGAPASARARRARWA